MSTEYDAVVFYGVLVSQAEVDAWEKKTKKNFYDQEAHDCHVYMYGDMICGETGYAVSVDGSMEWAEFTAKILTNEITGSWNERLYEFFKEIDMPYDKTPSWILTMTCG
jgi:hypothetical protein